MDDPIAVGTVIAFLIAGLISWWIIGSDSYKAEMRDASMLNMETMLNTLVERLPDQSVPIPLSLANLSGASVFEIKIGVDAVVKKLRAFGSEVKRQRANMIFDRPIDPNLSEQESLAAWNEQNRRYMIASDEVSHKFNAIYRPEALAYRDELRRRLGITDTKPDYRDVALEHGVLAGVDPLNDAANYLERLSRELS